MSEIPVDLVASEGVFKGLASQNLLFHQCIAELVDNAVAAHPGGDGKFKIDIIFNREVDHEQKVDVYVVDNSGGMTVGILSTALQLGESATTNNRLNEHGFGLKNALATLSGQNGPWKLWTRTSPDGPVSSAEGPFLARMFINDDDEFPTGNFLSTDASTVIKVTTKLRFLQTVQGRGAPGNDLVALREWLIEHLGVLYRGYLEQDRVTNENSGVITVAVANDIRRVPAIQVPLGNSETKYIDIEIGGSPTQL